MTTNSNRDSSQHSGISAALAHQAALGADAAQIAEAVVMSLQEMEAALSPIIGKGGVAALYKRSLYLSSTAHTWLGANSDPADAPMDLGTLKFVLVQQSSSNAAAGGGALLQGFCDLLASLIGSSLADRLLRSTRIHSL